MQSSRSLIITAAGTGSRFDPSEPKLLTMIHEHPVIWHSIQAFRSFSFQEIIVSTHTNTHDEIQKICQSFPLNIRCIPGGNTRADSVKNAVFSLAPCEQVLIHDGARPAIPQSVIQRLLEQPHKACIPVIPCTDTLKIIKDQLIVSAVDRGNCVRVQTPQALSYPALINAYQSIPDISSFTDESSLLQAQGVPIHTVWGDPQNIKLTTQSDLAILSLYLKLSTLKDL